MLTIYFQSDDDMPDLEDAEEVDDKAAAGSSAAAPATGKSKIEEVN